MILLSAKDLCSKSAMQIKFFLEHPEKKPTVKQNQIQGINYQYNISKKIPNLIGEEMGNFIDILDYRVYFTNDAITEESIIEIKNIDKNREIQDWYFKNSLIQCAIYATLSKYVNYQFNTAKFFVNLGNEFKTFKYPYSNIDMPYFLYFGENKFKINISDYKKIFEWFKMKVFSLSDWALAKEFDNKFNRKEFEYLKQFFNIEEI
jgi:hypothetical protein